MASDAPKEGPGSTGDPPATGLDTASITAILNSAANTREGLDEVFATVYLELKPLARRMLAGGPGATLTPTVLVHEAYAKLIGSAHLSVAGRRHFFALCARTMRQIVVDHARSRMSGKRGGGRATVGLTDQGLIDIARPESLVAMDEALQWLEQLDPRLVEVIQFRVFAGLPLPEIAALLDLSTRQLQRDWQRGRAWLAEALLGPDA